MDELESGKVEVTPLEPIRVTVTGTPRDDNAPTTQLIETPHGQRDVLVRFVTPLLSITLRFLYVFLTAWFGMMTGTGLTNVLSSSDFADRALKCAILSFFGAFGGLGKDLVFVVGKLKERYPLGDI